MKLKAFPLLALAGLFAGAIGSTPLLHAQETSPGQEMSESGTSAKGAMHETGDSVKHLYHATKEELSDAALTTRVKTALLKDRETRQSMIHVKSDRGMVSLNGDVDSPAIAAHAQQVASSVKGVESVRNNLTGHTSAR
jgi:osmotically-inducible protein OsmY